MREQIARTAGFNRVSGKERRRSEARGKGTTARRGQRGECSERKGRETEIIVEITYKLAFAPRKRDRRKDEEEGRWGEEVEVMVKEEEEEAVLFTETF